MSEIVNFVMQSMRALFVRVKRATARVRKGALNHYKKMAKIGASVRSSILPANCTVALQGKVKEMQ
jgi:hypothetical protein